MTVVYPQELTPLAQALSGMGFTMQPMGAEVAADAVLFTSSPHLAMRERPGAQGALLLNVRGMSAAQTAQALRRRSQAPLF
ncbi:MAG: YkuS family protein [Oscillospiraceae bacterium]|jgi:hypothetical protein|nr:YkuS family protein [Oscillospiraceae bacterium]